MAPIHEFSKTIGAVADTVGPSVVGLGRGWGLGSGVVVGDGRVLTNAHNVRRDEPTVVFADDRREAASVLAADRDLDLAVLEVDTGDAPAVAWSDAGEPAIGTAVLALANPGGRGLRVTPGFVSAAARSFRGARGRRVAGAIEHTAPLPRGSAGGPLVDLDGALLGVNTVRLPGGLILALPAVALRDRIDALARGEASSSRRLGVAVAPPRVARRLRGAVGLPEREGVLVRAVEDGSPADHAGLERGDLIVAAAGHPVEDVDTLYGALDGAGATLALTVVRGTEESELTVAFDGETAEV
ncbi:MAG TPA: trypsin-like peptidase domain-containing protein [Solirubrobacteraceae bacterium]|jgi:serine protease Do|nr:trypsin-like peptidase domain-containing protein [Solirubrobacteraceae bacterium]